MFSEFYDLLMEDIDYELLYQTIKPYLSSKDLIIDAGCGTGYFLVRLLKHDHQAIGIDMDTDMLKVAREKLLEQSLPQPLFEHDLRESFGMKSDVIISLFDVMHYFKGVKTVFQNIFTALKDNGRFIFDLYRPEVMQDYDGYLEQENEPIFYTWQIHMNAQVLTHNIKTKTNSYTIRQYIRPIEYYLEILKITGFLKIQTIESPDTRKIIVIAFK